MWHLIQPIVISGTPYCVKHGNTNPKWRTESLFEEDMTLTGAEDDDQWVIPRYGTEGGGSLIFGTCCLWTATVHFQLESDSAEYLGQVWLNGVLIDSFTRFGSTGEIISMVIDLNALGLMGRACGNEWLIVAAYTDSYTAGIFASIAISISDVTFGPPL
jgi:hypothetical protein